MTGIELWPLDMQECVLFSASHESLLPAELIFKPQI